VTDTEDERPRGLVELELRDGDSEPAWVEVGTVDEAVTHDRSNKPTVSLRWAQNPEVVLHVPPQSIAPEAVAALNEQWAAMADAWARETRAALASLGQAFAEAFAPLREAIGAMRLDGLADSLEALNDRLLADCTCLGRPVRSRARARRRCPLHSHLGPTRAERRRRHRWAAGHRGRYDRGRRRARIYLRANYPGTWVEPWLLASVLETQRGQSAGEAVSR